MPLLKNQKHERFAQLLATGASATDAYKRVYKVSVKIAGSAGGRLSKNVEIQQRLAELQQKSAASAVLTLEMKRAFLARVVTTPIGSVTPDSDLCQFHETSEFGRKIKMPDKLRAIELDANPRRQTPHSPFRSRCSVWLISALLAAVPSRFVPNRNGHSRRCAL